MNSSAINSILLFNHSSSGSSLLSVSEECRLPDYSFVVLYAVFVINTFMGYPANIMVIWLVARKEIDSSTSDVFFVNLAILDALFSLLMPLNTLSITWLNRGVNLYFLEMMLGIKNSSPLFLTCICLDRYVAVVHPIVFTSIRDNKIRVAISMLLWPFMIGYGFMRGWMKHFSGFLFTGTILTIKRTVQITLAIIVVHYLPIAAITPLTYLIEYKTICDIQFIAFTIMDLSCSIEPLLCISKVKQLPRLNNLLCIRCRSPSP